MGELTGTLAVIGAGNMGEAIVRGLISADRINATDVIASDPNEERRGLFAALGCRVTNDNATAVRGAATVLLAVKPQSAAHALAAMAPSLPHTALVLSIMAGVSTAKIAASLARPGPPLAQPIVRAMPNTPMLVGHGMTAICGAANTESTVLATMLDRAERIFGAAGHVVRVTEDQMDAVTAVSGSGPAYFFLLTELLAQAGTNAGLPPEVSATLARQTAIGAATMLLRTPTDPLELRQRVTSPGGTTQAALDSFAANHLSKIVSEAVAAATARSRELGR